MAKPKDIKLVFELGEVEPMGNAAKPVSLRPLKFDDAVAALLKVKPPVKPSEAEER